MFCGSRNIVLKSLYDVSAWLSAPVGTPGMVGLYVGSRDPIDQLSMMPMECLGDSNAGLQALHFPPHAEGKGDVNYTIPYDVGVMAFCGDGGGSAHERTSKRQRWYTCWQDDKTPGTLKTDDTINRSCAI